MPAETICSDPNRTLIPHMVVDAVVEQPRGAHPSYVQGYYDRDNQFYLAWDKISRSHAAVEAWLADWVYGVTGWEGYLEQAGGSRAGYLGTAGCGERAVGAGQLRPLRHARIAWLSIRHRR